MFSRKAIIPLFLSILLSFSFIVGNNGVNAHSTSCDENGLSVILMIGDGMGHEHVKLARLVEYGATSNLTMQTSNIQLNVTTYSADEDVTDSAAAATALATGVKTNNGMLSVAPNGTELVTILEKAGFSDKSTGLVATSYIQHATPAAFMTHIDDRNQYSQITTQILNSGVNVLLGGGSYYFSETQINSMINDGYTYVDNRTAMLSVDSGKILGLFSSYHVSYEMDRNYTITPSLAEMTAKSLENLEQDNDGFFLMVEGSRIDHASHDNDKVRTALDTIAFDEAVTVAIDYVAEHENTILIVTADHECGGLIVENYELSSDLPSDMSTEALKRDLRIERANNITVDWTVTYHTDDDVPLFYFGSLLATIEDGTIIDNTEVHDLMETYLSPELIPYTSTSSTDDTVSGTSSTTTNSVPDQNPLELLPLTVIGVSLTLIVIVLVVKKRA